MLHHGHGSKMMSRWKITMVIRFYHSSFHRTCNVTLKITSTNNFERNGTPRLETYEKKFSRHFPHTPSWYRMILPPAPDASFPPRSPQIISSDRHFGIRHIVFSVLYYVIKVTLHYLMLHRFEIHSALELSRTPALLGCCLAYSLTSLRSCSLAIIRFTIVIIILPVCNASQLTYQYATFIDNKAFSDLT